MFSPRNIILSLACLFYSLTGKAQTIEQYPVSNYNVGENYPNNDTSIPISLPLITKDDNVEIVLWDINVSNPSHYPQYGTLKDKDNENVTYVPNEYNEQQDSFVWKAKKKGGGSVFYRVIIDINAVNNLPFFATTNTTVILYENQNTDSSLEFSVIDRFRCIPRGIKS